MVASPPCEGLPFRRHGSALRLLVAVLSLALATSFAPGGFAVRHTTPVPTARVSTASLGSGVSVERMCGLASLDPLIFDISDAPDSFDPAVSFSVSGWGAIEQVYQTLVLYNRSSSTGLYGVLADRWTVSPDRLNYTFHLRPGIHFSNGDPFNAYTMWFSLYRAIATNYSPQFILSQNFWYPGINYYSSASEQANASDYLVTALNTWDFEAPGAGPLAGMMAANQSFQVLDAQTIELHVGAGYLGPFPYTYLLPTLATPVASAVDPAVVQAQGGVNGFNPWMTGHMMGTGPYVLAASAFPSSYTLAPDPNYWGAGAAAAESWNVALQRARSSVQVRVQSDPTLQIHDLESGAVVGITSDQLDAGSYLRLKADPCVVATAMDPIYGSASGGWWVYMDQNTAPFNNLSVRRAIAHVIDYDQIIATAFGGYGQRWVGPVPPGYPYYNPQNLSPYAYDVALAQTYMNESPWPLPSGYANPINYVYPDFGPWPTVALMIQSDLAKIGIAIHPVGVTISTLYAIESQDVNGVCVSETTYAGGPFPMGLDFWVADYLAPDDWTQGDAISYGPANMCMAHYANATMDSLVLDAASQTSPALLAQDYSSMTQMMYDNVTDAWLVVPTQFVAHHPSLRGLISNPMGQAPDFALTMNTLYAVPPLASQLSAIPSPAHVNDSVDLVAAASGGTPPYSYIWQFGDGATGSGLAANVTHVYATAGNYTAALTVRDSYGGYATASVLLVVSQPSTPAPPSPPEAIPLVLTAGVGIAAIAVATILALLLLRRRRRGPGPPAPPSTLPPPPAP